MTAVDWKTFWKTQDRILLAPMEGVVDAVTRDHWTQIGGIDLCVTEFIRVTDRLLPQSELRKYAPELFLSQARTPKAGIPVLVQFLGGQPQPMAENAAQAASLGAPGIDLNFGCPAKTVNRHDGGAALLKDPSRIFDVVSAVRKAVPSEIPVSAKVRLGFSDKTLCEAIAQAAKEGGASWLTVHARTRDEGYRPPAHWEYIAQMREAVGDFLVIANGEIWNEADFETARRVSGCRHVMIGRGLMSYPDLARVIRGAKPESWNAMAERIPLFAQMSESYRHEHYAVCRTKQWLKSLSRRYPEAVSIFEDVKRFDTLEPLLNGICLQRESNALLPTA